MKKQHYLILGAVALGLGLLYWHHKKESDKRAKAMAEATKEEAQTPAE